MDRRGTSPPRALVVGVIAPIVACALFILAIGVIIIVARGESASFEPLPQSVEVTNEANGTVTDFYPENNNLSDCIGLLERPGCGSESRGGWAQWAVFGILMLGLAIILTRVWRGVAANRRQLAADTNT